MLVCDKESREYIGDVMTNFDHSIDYEIAGQLKNSNTYAGYPAWEFHGSVWYEDEIVQYFVVNQELNMSIGKSCSQTAHVATLAMIDICTKENDEDLFLLGKWIDSGQKKIILRGKEKDLLKLIDQGFYYIRDNGLTEIPEGSLTAICLPPMYKSEAQKYVKRLQLL